MKAIFGAMVDHCKNLEEAMSSTKSIKYVYGSDGVYEIRTNDIGTFIKKTDKVIGAENIREGFTLNIPLIPYNLFLQILSFFKDVNKKYSAEVMVQILWHKVKKEYFIHCPVQKVTGMHIDYERNNEFANDDNYTLVLDIHSHNDMQAFFSPTDDRSEKETRLYGVIGRLRESHPEIRFRMGVSGSFKEVTMFEVFQKASEEPITSMEELALLKKVGFPKVDYPKEWMDNISVDAVRQTEERNYLMKSLNKHSKGGKHGYGHNYGRSSGIDYGRVSAMRNIPSAHSINDIMQERKGNKMEQAREILSRQALSKKGIDNNEPSSNVCYNNPSLDCDPFIDDVGDMKPNLTLEVTRALNSITSLTSSEIKELFGYVVKCDFTNDIGRFFKKKGFIVKNSERHKAQIEENDIPTEILALLKQVSDLKNSDFETLLNLLMSEGYNEVLISSLEDNGFSII